MKHWIIGLVAALLLWPTGAEGQTIRIPSVPGQTDTVAMVLDSVYLIAEPDTFLWSWGQPPGYLLLQAPEGYGIELKGRIRFPSWYDSVSDHTWMALGTYDTSVVDLDKLVPFVAGEMSHVYTSGSALMRIMSHYGTPKEITMALEARVVCVRQGGSISRVRSVALENEAEIYWDDASDATSWTVEYGLTPNDLAMVETGDSAHISLTGLTANTEYYYRVLNNRDVQPDSMDCILVHRLRTKCTDPREVVHDISLGPVTIPANSPCRRHVITGTTYNYRNTVHIEAGFHGTVVLRDMHMYQTYPRFNYNWEDYTAWWEEYVGDGVVHTKAGIRVEGRNNCPNTEPVTEVDFILDGENHIVTGTWVGICLQVDQGATVRFSSVNPTLNASGSLCATLWAWAWSWWWGGWYYDHGDAAIGSRTSIYANMDSDLQAVGAARVYNSTNYDALETACGNIVVTSGIITAHGGRGPGIGCGGAQAYDGTILVVGGILNCSAWFNSAGLGVGDGYYWNSVNTLNSTLIALPPAAINSVGASGYIPDPSRAIGGTHNIIYFGDTNQNRIDIHTVDFQPGVTIYADLSGIPLVKQAWDRLLDTTRFDLHAIRFGVTDSTGHLVTHGLLSDSVVFYTDGFSPTTGYPYASQSVSLTQPREVSLPPLNVGLAMQARQGDLLMEGYTPQDAQDEAFCLRIECTAPVSGLSFSLRNATDFPALSFLASDSSTAIAPPSSMQPGEVVYLLCPLSGWQATGSHMDVLHVCGTRGGQPFEVRQVVKKYVVPFENVYVCEPRTSYTLGNGTVVYAPGRYLDTLTTRSIVNMSDSSYVSCDGTQYDFSSQNMLTRDSIVMVNLFFRTTPMDTLVAHGCDSLEWRGSRYFESGIFHKKTPAAGDCDSLHTLMLTLDTTAFSLHAVEHCYWANWERDTMVVPCDTLLTYQIPLANGCDSLVLVNLHVRDSSVTVLDSLRWCYDYYWQGRMYRGEGFHDAVYRTQNQWGCDSIVHLPLTLIDTIRTYTALEGCDSVSFLGTTYTSSLHRTTHHSSADGCDSVSTVDLTVHPFSHGETTRYVCLGDEELGDFTHEFTTRHGCDSIVVEHVLAGEMPVPALCYSPLLADPDHLEIELRDDCPNAARREWFFNGEPYGDDGAKLIYHYPYGEDSVVVLLVDYTAAGCMDSARAVIPFAGGVLWVPNAFSPDMGNNREFRVFSQGIATMEVSIFTRAGLQVATFDGLTESWNGTHDGQPLPQASYTYLITYTTRSKPNTPQRKMGTVTLLR